MAKPFTTCITEKMPRFLMQFRHSSGGGGFAWKDIMYKNEGKGIVSDDPQQPVCQHSICF